MQEIKKDIELIKQRNQKVEADKAWETSLFRKIIITLMTYLVVVLFLWTIKVDNHWLNALVPTGGFVLSTLTLPTIKRWWIKNKYQ
jgi:hypothetical protein